ncbi:uncharacterized protein LOC131159339 [Malania oleifera]|uniref:uncharacterized protein LOC131159339 n=1 Tax=Malania oleifera TaxID=397392 RepID=UPI0025AE52BF|nr:uncharacterized protein LOC131159339 [Malania oleifera]
MATSAFRSATKRTPIGASSLSTEESSSSNRSAARRRSRSLSRFSRRPPESECYDEAPAPRGKFVNTTRGSMFPEISLDDLAIELFSNEKSVERGRPSRQSPNISSSTASSASQRRGRSVSRHGSRVGGGKSSACGSFGEGRVGSDHNPRRRRSVSVVRYQISDSESEDSSQKSCSRGNQNSFSSGNSQKPSLHKPSDLNHRQVLGRSQSQKDLLKLNDGYSSHSSALTDDEGREGHASKDGVERIIRAVYSQKKTEHPTGDDDNSGLYEAMRKELRHAVEDMRMELEKTMVKTKASVLAGNDCLQSNSPDVLQAVSTIRRNYATKLEQSAKRKQGLLAEILLEEERGKELSKIVRELLPESKNPTVTQKPSCARKRSHDRNRMSKRLNEEAEKYFEDFISNVEDTDISSFDGERSDGGSTLGGTVKQKDPAGEFETSPSPTISKPVSVEMDGVVLPWLQWETSNDSSPMSWQKKEQPPLTPQTCLRDAPQEVMTAQDRSNHSASSRGSWTPGTIDTLRMEARKDTGTWESFSSGTRRSRFDMDEYLNLQSSEDLLFETFKQQRRISSGGLVLCNKILI